MKLRCLFLIVLSVIHESAIAQRDSTFPLTVTVKLLNNYKQKQSQFDIAVSLNNTRPKSIFVWLMTCSWSDNFEFSNDNFRIAGIPCDHNYPELVEIEPNGSKVYALTLNANPNPLPWAKTDKLGLILIDDIYNAKFTGSNKYHTAMSDKSLWKIIWSNPLNL